MRCPHCKKERPVTRIYEDDHKEHFFCMLCQRDITPELKEDVKEEKVGKIRTMADFILKDKESRVTDKVKEKDKKKDDEDIKALICKSPSNIFVLEEKFIERISNICKHPLDVINGSIGAIKGKLLVSMPWEDMGRIMACAKDEKYVGSIETVTIDDTTVKVRALTYR